MTDTITLPRSVVSGALHALDLSQGLLASARSIHHITVLEEYKSLRAAMAQQEEHGIIRNFYLIGFLPSEEKRQQTVISQTELRAVLAQQADQRWQPIETAPKDGSTIIVGFGRQSSFPVLIVFYDKIHKFWSHYGEAKLGLEVNATHWMPLPAAPKEIK